MLQEHVDISKHPMPNLSLMCVIILESSTYARGQCCCPKCRYAEFGGEETKRQWEWKRRTEAEWGLWVSIGQFLGGKFVKV